VVPLLRYTQEKAPGIHWRGMQVGFRSVMEAV